MKRLFITAICIILSTEIFSPLLYGDVLYEYYPDRREDIRVGDILHITLELWISEDYLYKISGTEELVSEDYFIISDDPQEDIYDRDKKAKHITKKYGIMPSRKGSITILPVKIEYWHADDDYSSDISLIYTSPIHLSVSSNLADDTADPKQIRGPFVIQKSLWPFISVFVLILFLISGLLFVLNRRKMKLKKPEIIIPPEEIAGRKLLMLMKKGYLVQGSIKLFLFELTFIMKEYLSGAYCLNALDMTTREISIYLRQARIKDELYFQIIDFFLECDLYKFSDSAADSSKAKELYDFACTFVERDSASRKARLLYEGEGSILQGD